MLSLRICVGDCAGHLILFSCRCTLRMLCAVDVNRHQTDSGPKSPAIRVANSLEPDSALRGFGSTMAVRRGERVSIPMPRSSGKIGPRTRRGLAAPTSTRKGRWDR